MLNKPIYWIGTARKDLGDFPDSVKRKMGFQLRALQQVNILLTSNPYLLLAKESKRLELMLERLIEFFISPDFQRQFMFSMLFKRKPKKLQNQIS